MTHLTLTTVFRENASASAAVIRDTQSKNPNEKSPHSSALFVNVVLNKQRDGNTITIFTLEYNEKVNCNKKRKVNQNECNRE